MTILAYCITSGLLLIIVAVLLTQLRSINKPTERPAAEIKTTDDSDHNVVYPTNAEALKANWAKIGFLFSEKQWPFPNSAWSRLTLSQKISAQPKPKYYFESAQKDFIAFFLDEKEDATDNHSKQHYPCVVLCSYRIQTEPEPVSIHSQSLGATTESFMNTMIHYTTLPLEQSPDLDQLFKDAILVFQSMAYPSDSAAQLKWSKSLNIKQ